MINQDSTIRLEKEEEKISRIGLIVNCTDFIFFAIVHPKIGAGEPSMACKKWQSSYFREKQADIIGIPHLRVTCL